MAERKYMTAPVRAVPTRLMTTDAEKREIAAAAQKLGMPLSTFVREAALREARGGQPVRVRENEQ